MACSVTARKLPVTFGDAGKALAIAGFRVTEAAYSAHTQVARHEHQFASWTAVVAGEFREQFRHTEYTCRAGTLLSKPASAAHSNEYGVAGARVLIVEIVDAARETYAELRGALDSDVRMLPGAAVGSRIRRLRSELYGSEKGHSLGVHSAILDIALLLLRTPPKPVARRTSWLQRATDRLRAEFVQPPALSVVAAEYGVHPVHFCAAFRSMHGCSPGAFVRRLRVEHARQLLATTPEPVSRVAFSSGFSDQSHLTRVFRAATGMTPAQYRRQLGRGQRLP